MHSGISLGSQGSCCLGSEEFLAWLPGSVVWARAALWLQHQQGTDGAVFGMDGTIYPTAGIRQGKDPAAAELLSLHPPKWPEGLAEV